MYLDRFVEIGNAKKRFHCPAHPSTQAILPAVPVADPLVRQKRIALKSEIPTLHLQALRKIAF